MEKEVKEILTKIDNTKEIRRLKQLNEILNTNNEYLTLMNNFVDNKESYITNNTYNEELINLRKKLFQIDELNEYLKLQNDLRLFFISTNEIILSILN